MIEQGLFCAGIDAFAAFGTGGAGSSSAETPFVDGKCRTNLNAFTAFHTFFPVDAYLKGICLVCNRLKRAERTEQSALGPPFRQNRQHNYETDEKREKYDCLNKNFNGRDLHKFSDRLERAQPLTVGR